MQLHSKSGFIFCNNFDSGIYYSTSGYERPSSTHLPNIVLGSEPFIERIKDKIEDLGRRREIPSTRSISKYDVDTIITKMTQVLNIERRMIFYKKRGNLNRSLAIYLIKHFTVLSLAEIGQLFKIDYSAVSRAAKRFEQKSKLNHKVGEIKRKMITILRDN